MGERDRDVERELLPDCVRSSEMLACREIRDSR